MPNIKVYSSKFISALTSEKEFNPSVSKLLSLIFLAFAFIITLMPYSGGYFLYLFEKPPIYIRPDFISACCGLILLVPLYARGIIYFNKSCISDKRSCIALICFGIISFTSFANPCGLEPPLLLSLTI